MSSKKEPAMETQAYMKKILPLLENSLNTQSEQDYYSYDDIILKSDNIISELIEKTKKNIEYRKDRFLKLVQSNPEVTLKNTVSAVTDYVAEKANKLLLQAKEKLGESLTNSDFSIQSHLNDYLFRISNDQKVADYFTVKSDTIKKWIGKKQKQPSRPILFLVSFALDLPLKNDDNKYYSHEALFYKVFGQRSCSRSPDELCMIYCKKNNLSYVEALEMYLEFLQNTTSNIINEKVSKDKIIQSTRSLIDNKELKLMDLSRNDFVAFLIDNAETLDFKYSSISKKLKEIEKENADCFERIYDKYNSFFTNVDGRDESFRKVNRSSKVSGALPKKSDIFVDIPDKDDEKFPKYLKYIEEAFMFYDSFHKTTYSRDFYTVQRKRMIYIKFLMYWESQPEFVENDNNGFNDYIHSINEDLRMNYFSELLPYNDFDLQFILCAKRPRPLDDYFLLQRQMIEPISDVTNK